MIQTKEITVQKRVSIAQEAEVPGAEFSAELSGRSSRRKLKNKRRMRMASARKKKDKN